MSADVIREILKDDPATVALIGFTWGAPAVYEIRCYREEPPQPGPMVPFLIYHDVSGQKTDPPVNRDLSFDVVAWTADEVSCVTLADTVEKALCCFFGEIGGLEIDGIDLKTFRDAYVDKNTNLWYSIRTFEMIYRR
jgi:hypothetical protein